VSDGLGEARRRFSEGEPEAPAFHAKFLTSRVFFLAGDRPGVLAFGDPPVAVPVLIEAEGLGDHFIWYP
jgi:hypothetical protein